MHLKRLFVSLFLISSFLLRTFLFRLSLPLEEMRGNEEERRKVFLDALFSVIDEPSPSVVDKQLEQLLHSSPFL